MANAIPMQMYIKGIHKRFPVDYKVKKSHI